MGRKPRSTSEKAEEQKHFQRLGQHLKELREAKSLTPQDLAEKLGVTPQYIYMIESGKAKPSEKRLNELAEALGDLADEFLSTAIRQVEREFEAKLRGAGLSPGEIERAAQRVSARVKEDVVAGREQLRVERGPDFSPAVDEALLRGEEIVSLSADLRMPKELESASAYAAMARSEFKTDTRPHSRGRRASHGQTNICAGPDARIVVDRPIDDWERAALNDIGALVDRLLSRNTRRKS